MRFRLITYNIHKAIGLDRAFRPDRIIEILSYYDADIVLLQEVDRRVPRSHYWNLAARLARSLRYEYKAAGMNVKLKKGRYGNATLSRFPIVRHRNIDLSLRRRKRRGAQRCCIQLPSEKANRELEIFNVHLGLSATERREQVRRLLSTRDLVRLDPKTPCIVAGDMNDWRNALKKQRFAPAGFVCATNRPGSRWSIRTFPSYAPTGGLDKIFYRGKLKLCHVHRSRLKVAKVASDHLPVIADFEI